MINFSRNQEKTYALVNYKKEIIEYFRTQQTARQFKKYYEDLRFEKLEVVKVRDLPKQSKKVDEDA